MRVVQLVLVGIVLTYWLVSLLPAFFDGLFSLYYLVRFLFG